MCANSQRSASWLLSSIMFLTCGGAPGRVAGLSSYYLDSQCGDSYMYVLSIMFDKIITLLMAMTIGVPIQV